MGLVQHQKILRFSHHFYVFVALYVRYLHSQIEPVEPNPSTNTVYAGTKMMVDFQPDTVIALGGGSAMGLVQHQKILRFSHHFYVFVALYVRYLHSQIEPTNTVYAGTKMMVDFQPDTVIALGGGSAMDAAKGIVPEVVGIQTNCVFSGLAILYVRLRISKNFCFAPKRYQNDG
jgi:hypothetical protein